MEILSSLSSQPSLLSFKLPVKAMLSPRSSVKMPTFWWNMPPSKAGDCHLDLQTSILDQPCQQLQVMETGQVMRVNFSEVPVGQAFQDGILGGAVTVDNSLHHVLGELVMADEPHVAAIVDKTGQTRCRHDQRFRTEGVGRPVIADCARQRWDEELLHQVRAIVSGEDGLQVQSPAAWPATLSQPASPAAPPPPPAPVRSPGTSRTIGYGLAASQGRLARMMRRRASSVPLKGASSWNPCIRHHCMAEFTSVFPARAMAVCTRSMLRKLGALGEILPCSNRRLPVRRLILSALLLIYLLGRVLVQFQANATGHYVGFIEWNCGGADAVLGKDVELGQRVAWVVGP